MVEMGFVVKRVKQLPAYQEIVRFRDGLFKADAE